MLSGRSKRCPALRTRNPVPLTGARPPYTCRLKELNAKAPAELKEYYTCLDYYR